MQSGRKIRRLHSLRLMIALSPLYPAIRVNLDAAAGQGETWAIVGVSFVLFGALAIEHSLHAPHWRTAALWGALGVCFLCLNCTNAIANLASHTDNARDAARANIQAALVSSAQREALTDGRRALARAAGESTPDSIAAEIKAAQAANSRLWQASNGCDPNSITRDVTRAFCKGIADLESKRAAAAKRDVIDARLASMMVMAAPSTVDSFADAMADGLEMFGWRVDEKAKLALVRARDWSKAIGVELLAAFGPAALLGLLLRPSATMAATISNNGQKTIVASGDDDIDAFFKDKLKVCHGVAVPAGELFKAWQAWCSDTDRTPGTQKAFGLRMQRRAVRDPNNCRPRYLNIQLRDADHHGLRLAVNNT